MIKNTCSVVGSIDLSIKILSKEKFVSNQEATERLFINFDGKTISYSKIIIQTAKELKSILI